MMPRAQAPLKRMAVCVKLIWRSKEIARFLKVVSPSSMLDVRHCTISPFNVGD
ncbi:Hypothetical protein SMAX5B_005001 [Scophthalmus maximus]|uniref:Uncharacterized protein n=1 Tax=Scophthalmus maximus TaxID=52904 RepID=A0A2U9AZF4_SCOMX|nr:Hypothetical protein SMAX5B_005001 [Scophthalmus maximus]